MKQNEGSEEGDNYETEKPQLEVLVGYPNGDGFVRLITNPVAFLHGTLTGEKYIACARKYLYSVAKGYGTKPHCPFVRVVEECNGYYLRQFTQHPDGVNFGRIVRLLESKFKQISPKETRHDQVFDPTTIVAVFSHLKSNTSEFCSRLDIARDHYRQRFL